MCQRFLWLHAYLWIALPDHCTLTEVSGFTVGILQLNLFIHFVVGNGSFSCLSSFAEIHLPIVS